MSGMAAPSQYEDSPITMTDGVLRTRTESDDPMESKRSKVIVGGGPNDPLGISSDEDAAPDGEDSGDH